MRWVVVILADDDGELLAVGEARIRGTKTARSDRVVAMPEWLTARLRDRAERFGTKGLVFPTPGRWGTASREKERDRRKRHVPPPGAPQRRRDGLGDRSRLPHYGR
ncbi:hypothetical protein GCM10023350_14210 [Nocardioides endophyticus]|uniref:Uncharacterized protein n=1 Tax=Nocardioides endophyticus TaxID=1353775 RepID=A0ABP8YL89_9ACTN